MITFTVSVDGKKARADLRAIRARIIKAAGAATSWAGGEIERKAKASLREAKSGRKYPRLPRRSSAPGEAPAHQFGGLDKAISHRMVHPLKAEAKSAAFYAGYLEGGTSKMAARPHMEPALRKTVPEYISRIIAAIEG